jgi:SAM-dependent methyltransferase
MVSPAREAIEQQRELVPCRLCAGTRNRPYFEGRGFTVVRCEDCGLYYVNPQPSVQELAEIYRSFDSGDQWRRGEEHFNRAVCRAILRFKKSGTALDIGCGSGNFLRAMRKAGFEVYGIEPSETGSAYAREVHGVETFRGTVEEYLDAQGRYRFDVVSILNVIEHVKDPRKVLQGLRLLMREGAVLAVVVPDARLHATIGELRRHLGASDPFWMCTERHPLVGFDPPASPLLVRPAYHPGFDRELRFSSPRRSQRASRFQPGPVEECGKSRRAGIFRSHIPRHPREGSIRLHDAGDQRKAVIGLERLGWRGPRPGMRGLAGFGSLQSAGATVGVSGTSGG